MRTIAAIASVTSLLLASGVQAAEVVYSCDVVSATKGANQWDQVVIDWELPSVEVRYAQTIGTEEPFFERYDATTKTDFIDQVVISISKNKWINVGASGPVMAVAISAERFRDSMNLTYASTLSEDAWATHLKCRP